LDENDIFYYAGKPFTVSNEMDLGRLREAMIREQKSSKVYIRLRPSPDLLRSKEFVNQVAKTANDLKIPVQLEGSVLSHIYYMLTRQKVRVRCASPFLPVRKQRFGKLVRDLVPVTIEAGGEHARTITVPKEQLAKLLKTKALEEAFELFWESDNSKSFEEMADVMEVILSACKAYGRDFKDLVSLAEKKRKERGGFEKGVVLIETSNVPLIGTEDTETPLFAENTLAGASNKTSIGYPPSRRPRLRGRDLAIPLIPPVAEDWGKHYIISVPDEEYEFVLRYTTKEIVATIRKKSTAPPANQLELDLGQLAKDT
jgi:predicted house-cleaning noncanonical NTP pyrophosphatase (MazG superfamily)